MEAIILNAAVILGFEITKDMYRKLKDDSPRGGLADIKLSMGNHTEAYREVESPNIVRNIAKSSVEFNESTNELNSHFFYTNNNIVTKQLLGGGEYVFAFDSIPDMFETLSVWNYVLATEKPNIKRSSTIYLLDPHPAPIHLSHMDFLACFNAVTIVNHSQAKQMLSISSVKIHKGCSVKFEHLTLSHSNIEVTDGGCAYLHKCIVGTTAPELDDTSTTLTHDWRKDSGKVIFRECIMSPPTANKTWKPTLGRKKNDSQSILIDGITTVPSRKERTTASTAQQQQAVARRVETAQDCSFGDDELSEEFLMYLTAGNTNSNKFVGKKNSSRDEAPCDEYRKNPGKNNNNNGSLDGMTSRTNSAQQQPSSASNDLPSNSVTEPNKPTRPWVPIIMTDAQREAAKQFREKLLAHKLQDDARRQKESEEYATIDKMRHERVAVIKEEKVNTGQEATGHLDDSTMQISVSCGGTTTTHRARPQTVFADFMLQYAERTGIPVDGYIFIFRGKQLQRESHLTCAEHGLHHNSHLHLIFQQVRPSSIPTPPSSGSYPPNTTNQKQWQQWQQQQQQQQPFPGQKQKPHQQELHFKYAKQMEGKSDGDEAVPASIRQIKRLTLIKWALQPPNLNTLRPISHLITTIHSAMPPAFGVGAHEYFAKFTPITKQEVITDNQPDKKKLEEAVHKIRYFLQTDHLPNDLSSDQVFVARLLLDIVNDSLEEFQKHKDEQVRPSSIPTPPSSGTTNQQQWQQWQQQQQEEQPFPGQKQKPHQQELPFKYAKQMEGKSDGDEAVPASIRHIKRLILINWALQPPNLNTLRPISHLITTIHSAMPPAFGVGAHEYFAKFTPITIKQEVITGNQPDKKKLEEAVHKIRYFLQTDHLPNDLSSDQVFVARLLLDIVNDSWRNHIIFF
jgi:hypothetical protein